MTTLTRLTAEAMLRASAAAGARPDPLLTISQWADKYRTLSQRASSEPGQWRTDRTPYLREIMDCLSPSSHIERTVFMKGAHPPPAPPPGATPPPPPRSAPCRCPGGLSGRPPASRPRGGPGFQGGGGAGGDGVRQQLD